MSVTEYKRRQSIRGRLWDNPDCYYALLHRTFQPPSSLDPLEVEWLFIWYPDGDDVSIEGFQNGVSEHQVVVSKIHGRDRYKTLLDNGFKIISSHLPEDNNAVPAE